MRIVHLSTSDGAGGAARATYRLHTGLLSLGVDSNMVVARRQTFDATVRKFQPPNQFTYRVSRTLRRRRMARDIGRYRLQPGIDLYSDDRTEDGASVVKQLPPCDLINLSWVSGLVDSECFFDALPPNIPLVWRMADMNPMTGGCHYDGGCGKFTAHCGACPQLQSQSENDLSRQQWLRKSAALERLGKRLHLVATSRWMAGEANRSSLLGRFDVTVIPNGLNTDDFAPRDRQFARQTLGIPPEARVVLFVADSVDNKRKGFSYLIEALRGIAPAENALLLAIGGGRPDLGSLPHRYVGRISNDRLLSAVYSAADVYVIASLQEAFGQTVTESMACGTPVVGFASGGIVDMVRPGVTGLLAPTGDSNALRQSVLQVLRDPQLRAQMSQNCRAIALEEYAVATQARRFAALYETLIAAAA